MAMFNNPTPQTRIFLRAAAILAIVIGPAGMMASAQHTTVSLSAVGAVPQSDFQDNLDRTAFGASAALLYGFGPVSAGIEGGFLTYDRTARPLSASIGPGSALLGDVTTSSRIGHLHAVVRLQLPDGPVRPYVDGLVGFQKFTTKTDFQQTVLLSTRGGLIDPGGAVQYTQHTSSIDATDTALSYGAGGGLQIRLAEGIDGGAPFQAFLDIGVRYLFGEEATYRIVDVYDLAGSPVVELGESRTDMIRPQISLVVQFGR